MLPWDRALFLGLTLLFGCAESDHSDVADCTPSCEGLSCGVDGCGGSCGSCAEGESCQPPGVCTPSCVADCTHKSCGDDGCGGSCGQCEAPSSCQADGVCA